MELKEEITGLLYMVIDPEIGINIVDLGLVYDVEAKEESITVTMTLTTPGCPMHESITQWVDNILRKAYPGKEIIINLVWEPAWSPERMSAEARHQLKFG